MWNKMSYWTNRGFTSISRAVISSFFVMSLTGQISWIETVTFISLVRLMWKVDAVSMNTFKGGCILKKKFNLLFILFINSLLFACSTDDVKKTDDSEVYGTFRGTIEEINGNRAIVYWEGAGETFVDLSVNSAVTFQVGDKVEVGYDGIVMESHPAKINTLSVELVE